jgi:hypothetical protein
MRLTIGAAIHAAQRLIPRPGSTLLRSYFPMILLMEQISG